MLKSMSNFNSMYIYSVSNREVFFKVVSLSKSISLSVSSYLINTIYFDPKSCPRSCSTSLSLQGIVLRMFSMHPDNRPPVWSLRILQSYFLQLSISHSSPLSFFNHTPSTPSPMPFIFLSQLWSDPDPCNFGALADLLLYTIFDIYTSILSNNFCCVDL